MEAVFTWNPWLFVAMDRLKVDPVLEMMKLLTPQKRRWIEASDAAEVVY